VKIQGKTLLLPSKCKTVQKSKQIIPSKIVNDYCFVNKCTWTL